ncbi:hypothetical protein J3F84DRAFT_142613 [Trichoderma pleuroticola]
MIPDAKGTSRAVWPLAGQFVKEKKVYQHMQTPSCFVFFYSSWLSFCLPPFFSFSVFFSFPLWPDVSYKVWLLGVWWTCLFFRALIYNWMDNDRANLCGQQMP